MKRIQDLMEEAVVNGKRLLNECTDCTKCIHKYEVHTDIREDYPVGNQCVKAIEYARKVLDVYEEIEKIGDEELRNYLSVVLLPNAKQLLAISLVNNNQGSIRGYVKNIINSVSPKNKENNILCLPREPILSPTKISSKLKEELHRNLLF